MRLKYKDNSYVWNEDYSAIVSDHITIRQHAQQTVDRYNKDPHRRKKVELVMVRNLPKRYIIQIKNEL